MSEDQDLPSPAADDAEGLSLREGDTEEIDALPVPEEDERSRSPVLVAALSRPLAELRTPAVQAAAVAAGGFVAGAAVVGLARRRHASPRLMRMQPTRTQPRKLLRRGASKRQTERLEIVASKSLLVDLHLLGPQSRGR
ncbi:MAG TPA: hypothetical protein VGF95_13905 [Solirubrobacteraceae bacterium]